MKLLTHEEIQQLTESQAQAQLTLLETTYKVDTPLVKHPKREEVFAYMDEITNNLLWLEDRIKYVQMCDRLDSARIS